MEISRRTLKCTCAAARRAKDRNARELLPPRHEIVGDDGGFAQRIGPQPRGKLGLNREIASSRRNVTGAPGDDTAVSAPKILVKAGDKLNLDEHGLGRVALVACTFNVSSDVWNERPAMEPSDFFRWIN